MKNIVLRGTGRCGGLVFPCAMFSLASGLAEEAEAPLQDGLSKFMTGHVLAGNVRIPNLLWLTALIAALCGLIAVLVVLMVRLHRRRIARKRIVVEADVRMPTWRHPEKSRYVDFRVIYAGQVRQLHYNLRGDFTIGRSGCSLNLDKADRRVSQKHCHVRFGNGVLQLKDTSQNGTYVNGTMIRRTSVELRSGDRIQIGDHTLTVRY